jgi:hypothetical protein
MKTLYTQHGKSPEMAKFFDKFEGVQQKMACRGVPVQRQHDFQLRQDTSLSTHQT